MKKMKKMKIINKN